MSGLYRPTAKADARAAEYWRTHQPKRSVLSYLLEASEELALARKDAGEDLTPGDVRAEVARLAGPTRWTRAAEALAAEGMSPALVAAHMQAMVAARAAEIIAIEPVLYEYQPDAAYARAVREAGQPLQARARRVVRPEKAEQAGAEVKALAGDGSGGGLLSAIGWPGR